MGSRILGLTTCGEGRCIAVYNSGCFVGCLVKADSMGSEAFLYHGAVFSVKLVFGSIKEIKSYFRDCTFSLHTNTTQSSISVA